MTRLDEKVKGIIEAVSSEFNSLPFEERKRICKYTSEMQILTIWQMIEQDKSLTTESWRTKQRQWLKNCVENHLREY